MFARSPHTDKYKEGAVATRMEGVYFLSAGVIFVDVDYDVSSTYIRKELEVVHSAKTKQDKEEHLKKLVDKQLVPKVVCDYIINNEEDLYL